MSIVPLCKYIKKKFVRELKGGFVKAAMSIAVHLQEFPLRELPLYLCSVLLLSSNSTWLITSSYLSAKWKSFFSHSSVCIWPRSLQNLRENTAITIICDCTAKHLFHLNINTTGSFLFAFL